MKKFPTLYKRDSKGNLQVWTICVEGEGKNVGVISTTHGRFGGRLQTAVDFIKEGKNIGKANETTAYEQAVSEAESKWTKQQERKGYVLSPELTTVDQREGVEPMLAHRFDEHGDKIVFPCFVQAKIDGHRMLAIVENGTCQLFSRKRVRINSLPHIEKALVDLMGNDWRRIVFDGEAYNHEYKDKFEKLTGFILTKEPKEGHEAVQYYIYDLAMTTSETFNQRFTLLKNILEGKKSETLKLTPTSYVVSEEEAIEKFTEYQNLGYEGAMLRNKEAPYEGKRSYNLQKMKSFEDEEFKIIEIEEGRGKLAGHAIFVCENHDGFGNIVPFQVKMKGTTEKLKEIFENQKDYIGKYLTVQFQGRTAYGQPRFPVGLRVREDI